MHTVAGLWADTGGPVASITTLCRSLALRHEVCLLTGDGDLAPEVRSLEGSVRLRVERLGPYAAAHWSPRFAAACREEATRAEVVHDHGVWLHTNWASADAARRSGRPLVRSPRGMLSPWALSRSRLPKRLLWILREQRLFAGAAAVHATSDLELAELRSLGIQAPIVVVPNGVDTEGAFAPDKVALARAECSSGSPRRVLFLSRLHPKKGLDLLRNAWTALSPTLDAELVIAGAGDPRQVQDVERWALARGAPAVRYVGAVAGDEKLRLLAGAWLLVLPSRSENYGMAVAEALAAGTPVIATTATPWADLAGRGCGWTVEPTVPALLDALQRAFSIDQVEHARMRLAARLYIEQAHSIAAVAPRFDELYKAIAGHSP